MNYTYENLKKAFAEEAQANRKYLAFSEKAEEEGYSQVAKLFRAAAAAEAVHARAHLEKLGWIKSTEENLTQAIGGEEREAEKTYPTMILHAKEEKNKAAETGFTWAKEVEVEHAELYKKALSEMKEADEVDYYVCSGCGHTQEGEPEGSCPICGAPKEKIKKID